MTRRRNSRKIAVILMTVCLSATGCKDATKTVPTATSPPGTLTAKVQKQNSSEKNATQKAVLKQLSSAIKNSKVIQSQTSSLNSHATLKSQVDFSSKKDPFKPYIIQPVSKVKRESGKKANSNALPIQSYDVNKFRLEGIIAGLNENRALIVDPLRKGYVVKVGMSIGNNNGRITRISGNSVEVLEQFRDDDGQLRKRTVRLVLPHKK